MSTNLPWNLVSAGYVETVMPFLAQYTEDALRWAKLSRSGSVDSEAFLGTARKA